MSAFHYRLAFALAHSNYGGDPSKMTARDLAGVLGYIPAAGFTEIGPSAPLVLRHRAVRCCASSRVPTQTEPRCWAGDSRAGVRTRRLLRRGCAQRPQQMPLAPG